MKKIILAQHCESLTNLFFELGGDTDENGPLFKLVYEDTFLSDKSDNALYNAGGYALGSVTFFMYGNKIDLIIFIYGMQKAINKMLKVKLKKRMIRR